MKWRQISINEIRREDTVRINGAEAITVHAVNVPQEAQCKVYDETGLLYDVLASDAIEREEQAATLYAVPNLRKSWRPVKLQEIAPGDTVRINGGASLTVHEIDNRQGPLCRLHDEKGILYDIWHTDGLERKSW